MKHLKLAFICFSVCLFTVARAGEGMWLPMLLERLNEKEMRSMGMKITAKDIYNINKGSLKDAIVSFGGFCTGELISSKGLVLTNHHCGFDVIQNHSTLDRNYIRDGFWARNNAEELVNPGLFVTFIVRIDDVSKLTRFVQTRASFVAQSSLYGYLKTPAGVETLYLYGLGGQKLMTCSVVASPFSLTCS